MKIKKTLCTAMLTASAMVAGITPMTAYAYSDEPKDEVVVMEPEVTKKAVEEFEEYDPLTPDGNLTLVDDYGEPGKAGKQFVTLVTKNGNYFYLIIDRDDNGTETVHFLNLVDERDLLALLEDEEVEEYLAGKEVEVMPAPEEEPVVVEPVKKDFNPVPLISVGILALAMLLAGVKLLIDKKEKQKSKPDPDLDYSDDTMDDFIDDEILELPEEDIEDFEVK